VVVPSPATSFVFEATSRTSCAPMFSNGSSTLISFAIVTPSLTTDGDPNFFSRTTLRPRGPSVTFTASASVLMPRSSARRASSSNRRSLAAKPDSPSLERLLLHHAQDVVLAQHHQLVAVHFDLSAAVLGVHDPVADLHVHGRDLAVVQHLP